MNAFGRAITRSTPLAKAMAEPRKSEAEALWCALRADRQSRDERTARLRAMALSSGTDPSD